MDRVSCVTCNLHITLHAHQVPANKKLVDKHVCKDLVIYDSNTPDQNPFHELIPFAKEHKVLFHAVLAISALHLSNVTQRERKIRPILESLSLSNLNSRLTKPLSTSQPDNTLPAVYQHALLAKQKALRLLYLALEDPKMTAIMKLASVFLFITLELIDSGKDDWRPHVEGARMLIQSLDLSGNVGAPSTEYFRDCLVSNCLVYVIYH